MAFFPKIFKLFSSNNKYFINLILNKKLRSFQTLLYNPNNFVNFKSLNPSSINTKPFLLALSLFFWRSKDDINKKPMYKEIINLIKLAKAHESSEEYEEAEAIYHEALGLLRDKSQEKITSEFEVSQAKSYLYDSMADMAMKEKKFDKAEKLYKETMRELLVVQKFSSEENCILEISLKLAMLSASKGDFQLADTGYQFCFDILEKKIEKNEKGEQADDNTLALYGICCDSYANLLFERNMWKASLNYFKKALAISERVLGENHPQVSVIHNSLGVLLSGLSEQGQALKHFKKAVEIAKEACPENLPVFYLNMGELYQKINDPHSALLMFNKAKKAVSGKTPRPALEKIKNAIKQTEQK